MVLVKGMVYLFENQTNPRIQIKALDIKFDLHDLYDLKVLHDLYDLYKKHGLQDLLNLWT